MNEVPPRRYLAHYQFVQYNNNTIQYIPSTQQHGMPENPVSTAAQPRRGSALALAAVLDCEGVL